MDTIVYKLHNPKKYPIVIKAVQDLKGGKGRMTMEDSPMLYKTKSLKELMFSQRMDSYTIMSYNTKVFLPSSSGGVQICYDEQKEYIKFETSIPKFYFGNNVCEMIPSVQSKHYNASQVAMWNFAKYWHKLIVRTFQKIVHDLTHGLVAKVDWTDVEINRLDIAFNQLFDNPEDCHHYYDSVQKVFLPRLRDSSKVNYDGTVMIRPNHTGWMYKVYKKGPEFAVNQKPYIIKTFDDHMKKGLLGNNSNLGLSFQHIDFLQSTADRILRYELTLRPFGMSQLFNAHLKKCKIPEYKTLLRDVFYCMRDDNYLLMKTMDVRYMDNAGKICKTRENLFNTYEPVFYLPVDYFEHEVIVDRHDMERVTDEKVHKKLMALHQSRLRLKKRFGIYDLKQLKAIYKILKREDEKTHHFYVQINEVDSSKAIKKDPRYADAHYDCDAMNLTEETPINQKFSVKLLYLMILRHNQLFRHLQFEKIPAAKAMELLCKEYNKKLKGGALIDLTTGKKEQAVNVNQMRLLLAHFKHGVWDDLRKDTGVNRSTIYRWKKKMEKVLGFGKAINFIDGINLQNVSRDPSAMYRRHYEEFLLGKNPVSFFLQNTPLLLSI